jgi:formate hydrogenlyase subunit 6/NADH:ubiquinone oxidoreductase subunit I
VEVKEKTWQIDRLRCIVCACCAGVCPTKCLTTEMQYPVALTAQGGVTRVMEAGPKKKEPVRAPGEKKEE